MIAEIRPTAATESLGLRCNFRCYAEIGKIPVFSFNFLPGKLPLLYAFVPNVNRMSFKGFGCPTLENSKYILVYLMWKRLNGLANSLRSDSRTPVEKPCNIIIAKSSLGRPLLLCDKIRGPSISFSHGTGKFWAALCSEEFNLGVDEAKGEQFAGRYPIHRAFHEDEIRSCLEATGGNLCETAALVWSVKEAAVKALGCGFHLLDPLHIRVFPAGKMDHIYVFEIRSANQANNRFDYLQQHRILAYTLRVDDAWLSFALIRSYRQVYLSQYSV